MKKGLLLLISIAILMSCNDTDDNAIGLFIRVDETISNTDIFTYDLGSFGDEEEASIITQAEHFEISELDRDADLSITFTYKPQENYVGTDFIEIRTGRGSDGASENTEITNVQISLTITN